MIILVLAIDETNLIGLNDGLPWSHKEDILHLKNLLKDKNILVGLNTYKYLRKINSDIPNNAQNLFVANQNRRRPYNFIEYKKIVDIEQFLSDYNHSTDLYVIGGKQVYEYFIKNDLWDKMLITKVSGKYEGNVYLELPDMKKYNVAEKKDYFVNPFLSYLIVKKLM